MGEKGNHMDWIRCNKLYETIFAATSFRYNINGFIIAS